MGHKERFTRVDQSSQKRMYGPRIVVVCGFPAADQDTFLAMVAEEKLRDLPVVFMTTGDLRRRLKTLVTLPDRTGYGTDSAMDRAVVLSGISEKELHKIMGGYRRCGLPPALWATLTPVSENWVLESLLRELAAERAAMEARRPGGSS